MIIETLKKIDNLISIMEISSTSDGYSLTIDGVKTINLTEKEFKAFIADLTKINNLDSYIDYMLKNFVKSKNERKQFFNMLSKKLIEKNAAAVKETNKLKKQVDEYETKIKNLKIQIRNIENNNKQYVECFKKYIGE